MPKEVNTRSKPLLAARVQRLLIVVCADDGWTDDEWLAHVYRLNDLGIEAGSIEAGLVYAPHRAPTATQRRMIKDFGNHTVTSTKRLVLLSDSAIARSAMTAINWLILSATRIRALPPASYAAALHWLREVSAFDEREAARCLREMVVSTGMRFSGEDS